MFFFFLGGGAKKDTYTQILSSWTLNSFSVLGTCKGLGTSVRDGISTACLPGSPRTGQPVSTPRAGPKMSKRATTYDESL